MPLDVGGPPVDGDVPGVVGVAEMVGATLVGAGERETSSVEY